MTELETALTKQDWSLDGWKTRPELDRLMKENLETGKALWEQYCPWSVTNGGYIKWSQRE
jgi:hypothetical protein